MIGIIVYVSMGTWITYRAVVESAVGVGVRVGAVRLRPGLEEWRPDRGRKVRVRDGEPRQRGRLLAVVMVMMVPVVVVMVVPVVMIVAAVMVMAAAVMMVVMVMAVRHRRRSKLSMSIGGLGVKKDA